MKAAKLKSFYKAGVDAHERLQLPRKQADHTIQCAPANTLYCTILYYSIVCYIIVVIMYCVLSGCILLHVHRNSDIIS